MTETNAVANRKDRDVAERSMQSSEAVQNRDALLPPVDVLEDADGITLYADLPGVGKEQLNLRVDGDTIVIEAEASVPVPDGLQASYAEVTVPRYRRSFTLSRDLDRDAISAELKQGVLKLRIPKADHAQPRKIEVNVH